MVRSSRKCGPAASKLQYSSGGRLSRFFTLLLVISFPSVVTFRIVRAANVRGFARSRSLSGNASKSDGYCRYVTLIVTVSGFTAVLLLGMCAVGYSLALN